MITFLRILKWDGVNKWTQELPGQMSVVSFSLEENVPNKQKTIPNERYWSIASYSFGAYIFIFIFFKILFIHERHRERGRDTGRGRSRPHAGSRTWDSIPGLQGQALGCRRR